MKFPIIVCEEGDISAFASIEHLKRKLEAVDVDNGVYDAYDATGRLLCLSTSNSAIVVSGDEDSPDRAQELHQRLMRFLIACRQPEGEVNNYSLEESVAKTAELLKTVPRQPFSLGIWLRKLFKCS